MCTTSCSDTQPCGAGASCGSNGECWPGNPSKLIVKTGYNGTFEVKEMGVDDRGSIDGGSLHSGTFLPRDSLLRLKEGRFLEAGVPSAAARVQGQRDSLASTTCPSGSRLSNFTVETNEPVQFRRSPGSPTIEVYVPWPVQHTAFTCGGDSVGIPAATFTQFARVGSLSEEFFLDGGVISFQTMLTSAQKDVLGGELNVSVAHATQLEIIPGR
ncbi:MAG: hypothetical protein JNM69_17660 [Archangium sp.]|nr:hypothetical protein [Archangium sp.]